MLLGHSGWSTVAVGGCMPNEIFIFRCPACHKEIDVAPPLKPEPPVCPSCQSIMLLDRLKGVDYVRSGNKQ